MLEKESANRLNLVNVGCALAALGRKFLRGRRAVVVRFVYFARGSSGACRMWSEKLRASVPLLGLSNLPLNVDRIKTVPNPHNQVKCRLNLVIRLILRRNEARESDFLPFKTT